MELKLSGKVNFIDKLDILITFKICKFKFYLVQKIIFRFVDSK